jgi:hypothetical protein
MNKIKIIYNSLYANLAGTLLGRKSKFYVHTTRHLSLAGVRPDQLL